MNPLPIVVLLIALSLAHAKIDKEEAEKRFNKCKKSTGADDSFEDVILKERIPTSDKGMCLARCLMIENGILTENDEFSLEGTKKYFANTFSHKPENIDKSVAIAEECSKIDTEGLDKCEKAVKHISCGKAKAVQQNISLKD